MSLKKETFTVKENLSLENSFAVLKRDTVLVEITMGINDENYGWFELYDFETSGDEWYAGGGLWFENKKLTDYDGVFDLPTGVVNKLKEWGYDTSYVESAN